MKLVSFVIRPIQVLIVGGVLVFATAAALKAFAEFQGSRDRDRLVASIVHEQIRVSRERIGQAHDPSAPDWGLRLSDEDSYLRDWVIQKSFDVLLGREEADPQLVSASLHQIIQGKRFSPVLATSLDRWQEAFSRWSNWNQGVSRLSPEEIMSEARRRHFEAAGYRKIGRGYDATILYLWSAAALDRLIERWPGHPEAAEAVYLLGESMFRLKQGTRVLNLAAEAYADSIWSRQAKAMWSRERGNGT